MCMVTGALLGQATRSACQTDPAAAHWVVAGSDELDRQRGHAEELVVRLLALQAPVATDLRRVVSALWIVGDVHRMGVLAIHVAQATLRRYPEPVLPVTVRPVFARMGRIGEQLAGHAATALRAGNVALASDCVGPGPGNGPAPPTVTGRRTRPVMAVRGGHDDRHLSARPVL